MGKRALILLANGFEEIEALSPFDLLTRSGVSVDLFAVTDIPDAPSPTVAGEYLVQGSHGLAVLARHPNISPAEYDAIVLPGGMRGAENLHKSNEVASLVGSFDSLGKLVTAICASPAVVLHPLGIFGSGRVGVCYPGMESGLEGLSQSNANSLGVCVSQNIITATGVGSAFAFAYSIAEHLVGSQAAERALGAALIHLNHDR